VFFGIGAKLNAARTAPCHFRYSQTGGIILPARKYPLLLDFLPLARK
jgi:hypothetical protein